MKLHKEDPENRVFLTSGEDFYTLKKRKDMPI